MKRTIVILLFLFASMVPLVAQQVRVRLYSNATLSQLTLRFDLGEYSLIDAAGVLVDSNLTTTSIVTLKAIGSKVQVTVGKRQHGRLDSVQFVPHEAATIMRLAPVKGKERTYEGALTVKASAGKLVLINVVELETYIAGVAQSEIYGTLPDIYRVQAIISRTWALRNLSKHLAEGYNFCDHVHCQAYHNRCLHPNVMLSTLSTAGVTIVDSTTNLIETPFHSNSGGQTAASEQVWSKSISYLQPVIDTFSLSMKQAQWSKTIDAQRWLAFFAKEGKVDTNDASVRDSLLHFQQPQRQGWLEGVKLVKARQEFGLRSTFFSVSYDSLSHKVMLNGRGYGHGVGLSQEGAIRMAQLGIAYDSIIRFYYHGAKLNNILSDEEVHRNEVLAHRLDDIIKQDSVAASQSVANAGSKGKKNSAVGTKKGSESKSSRGKTTKEKNSSNKTSKEKSPKEKQDNTGKSSNWLSRLFSFSAADDTQRPSAFDNQDLETDWEYEW